MIKIEDRPELNQNPLHDFHVITADGLIYHRIIGFDRLPVWINITTSSTIYLAIPNLILLVVEYSNWVIHQLPFTIFFSKLMSLLWKIS